MGMGGTRELALLLALLISYLLLLALAQQPNLQHKCTLQHICDIIDLVQVLCGRSARLGTYNSTFLCMATQT